MVVDRDKLSEAVADARLDVVTGATATTAGLTLGANPVLATVVSASGPALKLVHRLASRALERRQDRAARALEQAARILDVGLDILEEGTANDDERLELLARIIDAAARTPLEEKVSALARVLAEGLSDGGSVDEAIVLAAALADLEAAHIFLLHHLAMNPLPPEDLRGQSNEATRGWDRAQLVQVLPEVAPVIDGLMAVLEGHGLVRSQEDSTWAGVMALAQRAVTPLGRQCLLLLGESGLPEPNGTS